MRTRSARRPAAIGAAIVQARGARRVQRDGAQRRRQSIALDPARQLEGAHQQARGHVVGGEDVEHALARQRLGRHVAGMRSAAHDIGRVAERRAA